MTHPDPALNLPTAQPAVAVSVPEEGILSSSSPAIRAIQDATLGEVNRYVQARKNVESKAGAAFQFQLIRTRLLSFMAPWVRPVDTTVPDASALVADLNVCREEFAKSLGEADDAVEYPESKRAA